MKNIIISEKQKKIQERIDREADNKHTHDWLSYFYVDRLKGTAQNMTSHCKSCGINWYAFKNNPEPCPLASNENNQSDNDHLPNLGDLYQNLNDTSENEQETKPKKSQKSKKQTSDQ
jgi:hypothetical protein